MDNIFLQEPYTEIREYHIEREKQAQDIIDKNVEALKSMLNLLIEALKKKEDNPELTA